MNYREMDSASLRSTMFSFVELLKNMPEDAVLERFALERRIEEISDILLESSAVNEPKFSEVEVTLLVSDKGVEALLHPSKDEISEKVSEMVRYDDARAIECRTVRFMVPLLELPAPTSIEPRVEVKVSQDIKEAVEAEMKRRHMEIREDSWRLLMEALRPGLYRFQRETGMVGMTFIEESKSDG
jgi:hypothetical protein